MEKRLDVVKIKFGTAFFQFFLKSRTQPFFVVIYCDIEIYGIFAAVSRRHRSKIGHWIWKLIRARTFQNAGPRVLPIIARSLWIRWRYDQSIPEARHLLDFLVGPIDPLKKLLVQVFAFLAGKLCGSRGGDIFLEFPKFFRPIVGTLRLQRVFEALVERHRVIKL